ncbi:MAG: hypothetical protein K2G44_04915 [Clostridia bacterium]|nr:hypothetical protein [Clostridia bacterium]
MKRISLFRKICIALFCIMVIFAGVVLGVTTSGEKSFVNEEADETHAKLLSDLTTGASIKSVYPLSFTYVSKVARRFNGTSEALDNATVLDSGTATSYTWRNQSVYAHLYKTDQSNGTGERYGEYFLFTDISIMIPSSANYMVRRMESDPLYPYESTAIYSGYGKSVIVHKSEMEQSGLFELELILQEEVKSGISNKDLYFIIATAIFKVDDYAPSISLYDKNNKYLNSREIFVNDSVKVNCSDYCSGVQSSIAYRSNEGSFVETSIGSFSSGRTFTDAGNYTIKLTDNAGHTATEHFTIDKSAPVLSLSGVSNEGYTSNVVTANWTEEFTTVNSQRSNENDKLTVMYDYSTGKDFPTSASIPYDKRTALTEEGNYLMTITDRAGNSSSYTFTIDKNAPTLKLSGVADGGYTNGSLVSISWDSTIGGAGTPLTNASDALTVKYSRSTGSSFPSSASTDCSQKTFSDEGRYILTISDRAQNSTSYYFVIDRTAPTVDKASEYSDRIKYTNHSFVFSVTDNYDFEKIVYRDPSGQNMTEESSAVSISSEKENFGEWQFRAYDMAGNVSAWYSVRLFVRDTFENLEEIKNGYKASTWYTVTLPAKIYTNIAGAYSFATYEAAFSFAMAKEREYRVEELSGGRYSYVNIANESVAQVYSSYEELEAVMTKYASSYISDRRTLPPNGATVLNPTDGNGVTRPDALTQQNLVLPSALSKYSKLPLYLANHNYVFTAPKIGVTGNKISGAIQFVFNGVSMQNGVEIGIQYGQKLETILKASDAWYHGYYLVTEQDLCGNIEQYLIFIDTELPVLNANVEYGNGNKEGIVFNEAFVSENANLLRYISVELNSIFDAVDEYSMVYINGRNLAGMIYVQGDELPVLNYENGFWGSYEVVVYDRSFNSLKLTLRIAGEEITVAHSSLTSETRCTLTVVNNDSNNAIVSIALYKVSYTGEEIPIYVDDDGTVISPENLSYILRTGGKYLIRITDIYGRTSEIGPLFYMKGLPSGVFAGVKDGGITKSDVKFTFSANCGVILYVWNEGKWTEATDDLFSLSTGERTSVASIAASASTSRLFKIFLYVTEDMNLFTEYQFEIDCIPPEISAFTSSGNEVQLDSVIRYDFYVGWDEANVSVYYYRQESSLGSLGAAKYVKGDIFTQYGTYVFEARDAIGNVTSFTITLDNIVSYRLEGSYSELEDGSYISKSAVTLIITEKTSSFVCTSSNGVSVTNGQALTIDGTYYFSVCDLYGNFLELTVIIDVLPPVPIITTVDGFELAPNSSTNCAFTVSCAEDNVQISLSIGSGSASSYTGEVIEAEGIYTFRMYDRVNNVYEFTMMIDQNVSFSIGGNGTYIYEGDYCYLSRGNISLVLKENYSLFEVTSERGNTFKPGEAIRAEDVYTVYICDVAGNELTLRFIIDQTSPMPLITAEDGSVLDADSTTNHAFSVSCDEDDAVIEWKRKEGAFVTYSGESCIDAGVYYFRITDRIGNATTFFVTIDRNVFYTVLGTFQEYANRTYASRTWLKLNITEDYRVFEVTSERGNTFQLGETIRAEDVYTVYICDAVGNDVQLTFIIDFTPPEIELHSDLELNAKGATRGNVKVSVSDYLSATYSLDGYVQDFTDEILLDEEGRYTITAKDYAGNITTRTFSIDRSVDVTLSKPLLPGQFITDNISFAFNEPMGEIVLTADGGAIAFKGGTIKEAGKYALTAYDSLGNSVEFSFEILPKTAREFVLTVPEGYAVTALLDGSVVNVLEGNLLCLTRDGRYVLEFDGPDGAYMLNLTVDSVAPTAEIVKSGHQITIEALSKENVTVEVYRNGKLINYSIGKALTEKGDYRVVLTDAYGNSNTYEVSLQYVNVAGIVCIVLACVVVAGAAVGLVVMRKRQGVR